MYGYIDLLVKFCTLHNLRINKPHYWYIATAGVSCSIRRLPFFFFLQTKCKHTMAGKFHDQTCHCLCVGRVSTACDDVCHVSQRIKYIHCSTVSRYSVEIEKQQAKLSNTVLKAATEQVGLYDESSRLSVGKLLICPTCLLSLRRISTQNIRNLIFGTAHLGPLPLIKHTLCYKS